MPNQTEWKRTRWYEEEDGVVEIWCYQDENITYHVLAQRFIIEWSGMKHIAIKKDIEQNPEDQEPNMREKNLILNQLKLLEKDEVALEVFPRKSHIVDRLNLYHIWVLEKKNFPYYVEVKSSKCLKKWKKACVNGKIILYKSRIVLFQKRYAKVYYLKAEDGSELLWYDKQKFKDFIIDENIIAVEYVENKKKNTTILVCLPKRVKELPFGLRVSR